LIFYCAFKDKYKAYELRNTEIGIGKSIYAKATTLIVESNSVTKFIPTHQNKNGARAYKISNHISRFPKCNITDAIIMA